VFLVAIYAIIHVPRGTLHNKPPRMKGTNIFLFIFITTTTKSIPHCTIRQFKNLNLFTPYLLFERFTLMFAPFLFTCTTKPPQIDGKTFFLHFFYYLRQEGTPLNNLQSKSFENFYIFTYFVQVLISFTLTFLTFVPQNFHRSTIQPFLK